MIGSPEVAMTAEERHPNQSRELLTNKLFEQTQVQILVCVTYNGDYRQSFTYLLKQKIGNAIMSTNWENDYRSVEHPLVGFSLSKQVIVQEYNIMQL